MRMNRLIKGFASLSLLLSFGIFSSILYIDAHTPDTFTTVEGRELQFSGNLPIEAKAMNNQPIQLVDARAGGNYKNNLNMFGIIPVKQVTVNVVNETKVIPAGNAFGVKLYTNGVVVIGLSEIDNITGAENPAYKAGIRAGDVIVSIDGKVVNTNEEVASIFENSQGKELKLIVKRGIRLFEVCFKPIKSSTEGVYKAGMWVRDSTAGIGTLTFFNETRTAYTGLGHGICDVDTGKLLPLMSGEIVSVDITGIVRSTKGKPGELQGKFKHEESLGTLNGNLDTGIFGKLSKKGTQVSKNVTPIPVAMRQDIQLGKAEILTNLSGHVINRYTIEIERVNYTDKSPTKNMVIRVTDPALLEKTGGIVQGMSGSPIIQNNKVVGAVTHVFINDSKKGYAIFAENMLKGMSPVLKAG